MRYLVLFTLLISNLSISQNRYPQDYFREPLDVPIILAGTFAELRSNHFHSGIDIKTQKREGLNVYTSAPGYVRSQQSLEFTPIQQTPFRMLIILTNRQNYDLYRKQMAITKSKK